jgi:hypothetical protein
MPRTCTACSHPQRPEIDRALVDGITYRTIADRFGLSETALKRHRGEHLPGHVAKAHEAAKVADADDLLQQLKALRNKAIAILQKAETAGDYRTALMGIREARGCIEVLMEVEGELDRRGVVNITVSADWVEIRSAILVALHPYPDAAQAVAGRLQTLEGGLRHEAG